MPQNYPTSPFSKYGISVSNNTFHKLGERLDSIDMPVHSNLRDKYVNLLTSHVTNNKRLPSAFKAHCDHLQTLINHHEEINDELKRLRAPRTREGLRVTNQTNAIEKYTTEQTTLLQRLATYMQSSYVIDDFNKEEEHLRLGYNKKKLASLPADIHATTNLDALRSCLNKHKEFFVFATVEENHQVMHAVTYAIYRIDPLIQAPSVPPDADPDKVIKFDHQLAAIRQEFEAGLADQPHRDHKSFPETSNIVPDRLEHCCFELLRIQAHEFGCFVSQMKKERQLAFMMGTHPRLGAESLTSLLDPNVMNRILEVAMAHLEVAMAHL